MQGTLLSTNRGKFFTESLLLVGTLSGRTGLYLEAVKNAGPLTVALDDFLAHSLFPRVLRSLLPWNDGVSLFV